MNSELLYRWLVVCVACLGLVACGNVPSTSTTTPPATGTSTPAGIGVSALPVTLKSDGSNSATITAIVSDSGNAAVSGATVIFSATGGLLGATTATTDTSGVATTTFSSGTDRINQTVTITASVVGATGLISAQVPVQISGTTLAASSINTNIPSDGSLTDTLTVTLKDAANSPIYNQSVSCTQTGAGSVSVSPAAVATDVAGQAVFTITGTNVGTVDVTCTAAGASVSQAYTVSAAGTTFGITSPSVDPYSASVGTGVPVTVSATGVANVTFATSLGTWTGGTGTITVAVVANQATATLNTTNAGIATVQVYDAANPATTDLMKIAFSQPATAAANIAVQSNVNVVAISSGGTVNTATITATVTDSNSQAVGGAGVQFSIPNPTGGGESVSPIVVSTDSFGKAQTTFSSGSVSSGAQGVDIYANILPNPVGDPITDPYTDKVNIVIGGTAGSVVIGVATVAVELSPTTYSLPMSVLVADSNGSPVQGAQVTLKAWPSWYRHGIWIGPGGTNCVPWGYAVDPAYPMTGPPLGITEWIPNEDANRDLFLNPGEDRSYWYDRYVDPYGAATTYQDPNGSVDPSAGPWQNADTVLTPANSAAGTLPGTVITDANGVANFDLVYLKAHGAWIADEITASTQVFGTEATAKIEFVLPVLKSDAAACVLPDSPF